MAKTGIIGTAVSATEDGKPVIVVFSKSEALAKAAALPATLENFPMVVEVTGEFFALSNNHVYANSKSKKNIKTNGWLCPVWWASALASLARNRRWS